MKTTISHHALSKLLTYLTFTGLTCNLIVSCIALYLQDYFLLSICLFLGACTLIGYISSLRNRPKIGTNIILGSYIGIFTLSSFSSLVSYPLALIFPLIIGLVNMFYQSKKVKNTYILLCLFGCSVCLINANLNTYGAFQFAHLFNSLLIGTGLLFAFIVITENHGKVIKDYQKELEESKAKIQEKNQRLNEYIKTNLQLENFAYLASHELKTPIKNISNFNQLLERKLYSSLQAKEKELFDMVKMETRRMNIMMKDLLKLSQLTKSEMQFSRINGTAFINKILEEQNEMDRQSIVVKKFPIKFFGAETQLSLLFLNILDNAFKFTKNATKAHIVIDFEETNGEFIFSVSDNGIGIADAYKERVFLIFKKLQGADSCRGSGIGLSMCKEIINRHQGQIWVEDNFSGGTIIKFSISTKLNNSFNLFEIDKNKSLELINQSA